MGGFLAFFDPLLGLWILAITRHCRFQAAASYAKLRYRTSGA